MPRRRLRAALAAAVAAPLLIGPVGADAASGPLTCPAASKAGLFQRLPIEAFRGVASVQTRDVVTGYALDERRPERVLATNGNTVKLSTSHGCAWDDVLVLEASASGSVPLSGVTSTIVAVAHLPSGPALAAVREGTGAASRPHVVRSGNGGSGGWAESSSGLPPQGSPRLLEPASDGRTAYLSLSPTTDASGGNGGTLPTVPGVGSPTGEPAGLLYATTDGGSSWELRTTAGALPSGASGFDALAVDAADPNLLYGVAGGRFVVSRDGGRSLEVDPQLSGVTAVEPMDPGEVSILVGSGQLLWSRNAGREYVGRPAPAGGTSLAHRPGSSFVVVEAGGRLHAVEARGRGANRPLDTGVASTAGSARGDRASGGSFHALAGHSLLRYVDPLPPKAPPPPPVSAGLEAPPPPPGSISPSSTSVRMPVGESRDVALTLALKKSPTPVDVFFLVDNSDSSGQFMKDLKSNLNRLVSDLAASGADVAIGLGTLGPGPRDGEPPYPESDPTRPGYVKPELYKLRKRIGPPGPELRAAVDALQPVKTPQQGRGKPAEGNLIALQQMVTGEGLLEEGSSELVPRYLVPPRQQAGFRRTEGVRHIVVHAADEAFDVPYGTPTRDGKPFHEPVAKILNDNGIEHIGLATDDGAASIADLARLSELTGTYVPPGGIDCGDFNVKPGGAPLVCDTASNFSNVMGRLVQTLADRQSVSLVPSGDADVIGGISAAGLANLDVTVPHRLPFRVTVSCADLAAGSYTSKIGATLRGYTVATARIDVTCTPVPPARVTPPRPDAPPVEPAPPAQPAQAPPAPAPAPPVVQAQAQAQVQSQVQAQAQVQPLTAAALQQQEELQLALALLADERPSPGSELAMVDRRRSEELRALALLALGMSGASALGVARLRSRRAEQVRVVRSR